MGKLLGTYIRGMRKQQKMPSRILAEKAGVSKSFIDYVENGLREPSFESLARIAAVLDASLEELIVLQTKEQALSASETLMAEIGDENDVADKDDFEAMVDDPGTDFENMRQRKTRLMSKMALRKTREVIGNDEMEFSVSDELLHLCNRSHVNPDLEELLKLLVRLDNNQVSQLLKVVRSLYDI